MRKNGLFCIEKGPKWGFSRKTLFSLERWNAGWRRVISEGFILVVHSRIEESNLVCNILPIRWIMEKSKHCSFTSN
jgi:hypothetical protein